MPMIGSIKPRNAKTIILVWVIARLRQKVPILPNTIKVIISYFVLLLMMMGCFSFCKRYRINDIEKTTASKSVQNKNMPNF